MNFPTKYNEILTRVDTIDPVEYATTRNYIDGSITYLSPYLSRGVISTKQILAALLEKDYHKDQILKLVQELAWREYYQRVWQSLSDGIFTDIFISKTGVISKNIPSGIIAASTGIKGIDKGIEQLYVNGYIHNHIRMYIASLTCNIARVHWPLPSQWMYYHLLDGDLASNTCSWQWVAGTFSQKKYYCNQENVNKYTYSKQHNSFLDRSYDELKQMNVPEVLKSTSPLSLETQLPFTEKPVIDESLPILLYNSYNLDPLWRKDEKANRVLLLEPSHFRHFPVSEKVLNFIIALASNIPGIQIFAGEISDIPGINKVPAIYSKEHPAFLHYPGSKDERDWMFPEVTGFYNSFFQYWKKCGEYFQFDHLSLRQRLCA